MTTPDSLNLEIVTPQSPLVLADGKFLATLTEVETQIASLAITDAPSAQLAASLQVRLTSAGGLLDQTRKQLKEPFIQAGRQIDAAASAPANRIEAAKTRIKLALSAYAAEQARIAREAEEARQKELRRLEAIAREEERLAKEKADAIAAQMQARQAPLARLDESVKAVIASSIEKATIQAEQHSGKFSARVDAGGCYFQSPFVFFTAEEAKTHGDLIIQTIKDSHIACEEDAPAPEPVIVPPPEPPQKTETQKAIEAVRYAPAAVVAKPVGVRFKISLQPIIEDVNKLPDAFVVKTPKIQAIKSTFCAGFREGDPLPVLAGVRFEIERTTESDGRARF